MPLEKISILGTFRLPIVLKKTIDEACRKEKKTFSEFCREGLTLRLEAGKDGKV